MSIRSPQRIAFLKACCIGDVVFATALLAAVRRSYPDAQIDWWVSRWSAGALEGHAALQRVINTGDESNPAGTPRGLFSLARRLRAGRYDMLIAPERSRLISLAALLSGIPVRAGLDSAGRGMGYNVKARIDPAARRHEAEIYLDIARALGLDTADCWANAQPRAIDSIFTQQLTGDAAPLLLVHPGGGVNPGMRMTSKRWPADRFAAFAARVSAETGARIVLIGAEGDRDLTRDIVHSLTDCKPIDLTGQLTLMQTAALATLPQTLLYIGNDNGVAHLAAACGGKVLMIFGPSDPLRYAPFVPNAAYAWKPVALPVEGVSAGAPLAFDWARDGVSVEEALSCYHLKL